MSFYTFYQNNVGGEYIVNEDIACFVIVEAKNAEEAESKIRDITEDYDDYCDCCGSRWNLDVFENMANDEPMAYGVNVRERKVYQGFSDNKTIIYYSNGTKEKLWFKDVK